MSFQYAPKTRAEANATKALLHAIGQSIRGGEEDATPEVAGGMYPKSIPGGPEYLVSRALVHVPNPTSGLNGFSRAWEKPSFWQEGWNKIRATFSSASASGQAYINSFKTMKNPFLEFAKAHKVPVNALYVATAGGVVLTAVGLALFLKFRKSAEVQKSAELREAAERMERIEEEQRKMASKIRSSPLPKEEKRELEMSMKYAHEMKLPSPQRRAEIAKHSRAAAVSRAREESASRRRAEEELRERTRRAPKAKSPARRMSPRKKMRGGEAEAPPAPATLNGGEVAADAPVTAPEPVPTPAPVIAGGEVVAPPAIAGGEIVAEAGADLDMGAAETLSGGGKRGEYFKFLKGYAKKHGMSWMEVTRGSGREGARRAFTKRR